MAEELDFEDLFKRAKEAENPSFLDGHLGRGVYNMRQVGLVVVRYEIDPSGISLISPTLLRPWNFYSPEELKKGYEALTYDEGVVG